jgi:glycosyltransferase involved in cell wall biosynthesis
MFPRVSETFIRNEILELERQGLSLRIFSLKRPEDMGPRWTDSRVRASIVYLPQRVFREPFRVFRAQIGTLCRYSRGYIRTLMHVLRGREVGSLSRGLRRFCQTCCLVHEMDGVRHLHAHFANDPTRIASWARRICNISYSVTTHAKDLYQENRIDSQGLRNKLSSARFVVANSQFSASGLKASFNGTIPPKIVTIYNGVDLSDFTQRSVEPEEPRILSVARLVEKKGLHDLLIACRKLKDWNVRFTCEIIGSGPHKESLARSINALGLDRAVKLRGQMPQHEVREQYLKAAVFVLPCVVAANGDRDILPNVLKEAMAIGVPVVTTQLEGIDELVTHEKTGLVVSPGDTESLAKSLKRFLSDAELRRRITGQARKVIEERFDLRRNFSFLHDLLLDALQKPKDAAARDIAELHHDSAEIHDDALNADGEATNSTPTAENGQTRRVEAVGHAGLLGIPK